MFDYVIAIAEQAVVSGPKPHGSAPVLQDRPNLLVANRRRCCVLHKSALVPAAQSSVGSYPNIMVAILAETLDIEVGQTVGDSVTGYPRCGDAEETDVGCNPNLSATALKEAANEVTNHVVARSAGEACRIRSRKMIDAAAVCAHPGRTILCAIQAPYGCVLQTRKLEGNRHSSRDLERIPGNHPNIACRRAGYCAVVIVEAWKLDKTNLASLQTNQPVLSSYPDTMIAIFEDAQNCINRQKAFIADAREQSASKCPQALAYRSY